MIRDGSHQPTHVSRGFCRGTIMGISAPQTRQKYSCSQPVFYCAHQLPAINYIPVLPPEPIVFNPITISYWFPARRPVPVEQHRLTALYYIFNGIPNPGDWSMPVTPKMKAGASMNYCRPISYEANEQPMLPGNRFQSPDLLLHNYH
jgi:hypothetical protein